MLSNKFFLSTLAVVVIAAVFSMVYVVKGQTYSFLGGAGNSLYVAGGGWLNDGAAPKGLIVSNGNVGIGDIDPDEKLVVAGNGVFGVTQAVRIGDGGVQHYETSDTGGSTYYNYNETCGCDFIAYETESGGRLVDFGQGRMSMAFMNVLEDFFTIPEAAAVPQCYSTVGECEALGCQYCQDQGTTCASGEYACTISCDDTYTGSPIDASCNAGDTELSSQSGLCWGEAIKYQVKCRASNPSTDYFTKMEFLDSPQAGSPARTVINDNIVAEGNVYGDGDSSNGVECAWETDNECDNNRFLAGYDDATDQIYCCDL